MPAIAIGGLMAYVRSPYGTNMQRPVDQPIEFDHRHHVGDEQIDCRYCHWTVEKSPSAGIPSTTVCMACHAQVWNKSPYLSRCARPSSATGRSPGSACTTCPDFVYFNHSIHVNKGVGCVTCHGRVDEMAAIEQKQPLTMGWCLDCHRDPEPQPAPARVHHQHDLDPARGARAGALGEQLAKEYDVHSRTSCSTCHR